MIKLIIILSNHMLLELISGKQDVIFVGKQQQQEVPGSALSSDEELGRLVQDSANEAIR